MTLPEQAVEEFDTDTLMNSWHLKHHGPIGPQYCSKCRLVQGGPCWDCVATIVRATSQAIRVLRQQE